ncbi:MAG TPA: undecaprenyldiphospho-muramoylpentapeptide beta-N-acetylglucosaminyltransferase [Terriglobales bacterium]|nr:undecaprenyldiphospho-muramoylpentapeptide beta-N-acetylglucosaminyltransferase [Terriglobales bacterium]
MKVAIVGGGTGGHVIPALAIARELRERHSAEVMFVGTSRGIESRLVPQAGFPLQLVEIGQLKNVSLTRRLQTLRDIPRAVTTCRKLFLEFRPHVVIGVGGYASGPGMLAAIMMRVPTLAFEPNLVPGFANRMVARFVTAAAVHFEQTKRFFRNAKVTGVPVRQEFFNIPAPYSSSPRSLLVFGGSQGARVLNQTMIDAISNWEQLGIQVRHQTGERDFEKVDAAYKQSGFPAQVSRFIDDMPAAFAEADLVLCRSGASTVGEITAAGKPAILVPFPFAADDHQFKNAEALQKVGAARLIPESQMTADRLANTVAELLASPSVLADMASKARSLAHPKAVQEIGNMAAELSRMNKDRNTIFL